jgi:hypothetical protein
MRDVDDALLHLPPNDALDRDAVVLSTDDVDPFDGGFGTYSPLYNGVCGNGWSIGQLEVAPDRVITDQDLVDVVAVPLASLQLRVDERWDEADINTFYAVLDAAADEQQRRNIAKQLELDPLAEAVIG